MSRDDLRKLMKSVALQFEATKPPKSQETRDVRGRWLYADVALEKGRADGEERAAAWLAEMKERGFVD